MPSNDRFGFDDEPALSSREPVRIGRYVIESEIGKDSTVFVAHDPQLQRRVAVKMILHGSYVSADNVNRFLVEARAAAQLNHPGIVPIYEIGVEQGQPYFVMPLMEGGTLQNRLADVPLLPKAAASVIEQIARATHHAHEAGIIHRDLKPSNILFAAPPSAANWTCEPEAVSSPRITDFGLAKRQGEDAGQTHSGAVMGTPSYMSPEQAQGRTRDVGPGTDVYSLGAILYEALTGRPPFRGATALETLNQVLSSEPLPPRRLRPLVPRDLETICLKCLEKEPTKRYRSAADLAEDLRHFIARQPIQARSPGLIERIVKWVRRRRTVATLASTRRQAP